MEQILISILAVNGILIVMLAIFLWMIARTFTKKIIEPKMVYEEPGKEKIILVPGKGVFGVKDKRPVKYTDEIKEWAKEQNEKAH